MCSQTLPFHYRINSFSSKTNIAQYYRSGRFWPHAETRPGSIFGLFCYVLPFLFGVFWYVFGLFGAETGPKCTEARSNTPKLIEKDL